MHIREGRSPAEVLKRLNLYDRAESKAAAHLYLRFGRYLRDNLSQPEKMTLVFGDVGCVPYASGCRIVDTNGLTEPYLVKLILEKDLDRRQQRFVDYIMRWSPDLIVIGYGESSGTLVLRRQRHSLFQRDPRIGVYAAYRNFGVKYLCSMHSYFDLHFGVRPGSPHFAEVAKTVLDYCDDHGYVLPQGLTLVENGESVSFPRLLPSELRPRFDDDGQEQTRPDDRSGGTDNE